MKQIFYNGQIVTMEQEGQTVSAMLVDGDKIAALGSDAEIFAQKTDDSICTDLGGKTVLPGFVDAHGHFQMNVMARHLFIDASCAPAGKVKSIGDLQQLLRDAIAENPDKNPVIAFNFDDTLLEEYRMPEAKDLDAVSAEKSIMVVHASIHMMAANTKAMESVGMLNPDYKPLGGNIYYDESGMPNGIIEETPAMMPFLMQIFSPEQMQKLPMVMGKASDEYLSCGITTVSEGGGDVAMLQLVEPMMQAGLLKTRYILCCSEMNGQVSNPEIHIPDKIFEGPVKLIQDGSIQCYTAYLSAPYATNHPVRVKPEGYCGFPHMTTELLQQKLETIIDAGKPFAIHANGDAAIDTIIEAVSNCRNLANIQPRNLIIHCQTVREDQLDKMKALSLYPSFFPAHIYVWGDRHAGNFLGAERAARISPCASALNRGLRISLHNDEPVTKPEPLGLVWNAAARTTSSGRVLGAEQAISVYDALKAVTIDSAWQYGVEDRIGSLAPGKKADFIVLAQNPLTCAVDEIPHISIEQTWVDGKQVWHK